MSATATGPPVNSSVNTAKLPSKTGIIVLPVLAPLIESVKYPLPFSAEFSLCGAKGLLHPIKRIEAKMEIRIPPRSTRRKKEEETELKLCVLRGLRVSVVKYSSPLFPLFIVNFSFVLFLLYFKANRIIKRNAVS
jgi:hypothetical protein